MNLKTGKGKQNEFTVVSRRNDKSSINGNFGALGTLLPFALSLGDTVVTVEEHPDW